MSMPITVSSQHVLKIIRLSKLARTSDTLCGSLLDAMRPYWHDDSLDYIRIRRDNDVDNTSILLSLLWLLDDTELDALSAMVSPQASQ